jgi:hypothetical protein
MPNSESDSFYHYVDRSNIFPHKSFDGSQMSCTESSRVYNMRLVSGVSLKRVSGSATTGVTVLDGDFLNFGNSHVSAANESFTEEKGYRSGMSAASLSCVQEAICIMVTSVGNSHENEQRVADECFRLAMWTSYQSSPSGSFQRLESAQNLTLHEVALFIVSSNGIDAILRAMEDFPNSAQIQELACTALGNILSILYPRRTANRASFYQAISKGDTIYSFIIRAMQNHCQNVSVFCAAIPALQHYQQSIFFNPLYSFVSNEDEKEIFKGAKEMFLPAHVRTVFHQLFS